MTSSQFLFTAVSFLLSIPLAHEATCNTIHQPPRQSYTIFVDEEGIMRRSDNQQEVSYYGTNYTAPFAYSYRALNYLNHDIKETIQNDVAQMARLGFNAFRLHLWDVELADNEGNLIQNQHLDLLDFLIAELEKKNIDIILTAQTNFGNGYPEKDINTGAYSYNFPKCGIHENEEAIKIQENYLRQLVDHHNPYSNRKYADDKAIIAFEINNEPCHTGSSEAITSYINRMTKALRNGGFDRIALYNVSHNEQVRDAYYDADIQGTTFQWYPSGLVAGHERKGNFLPAVADYAIPWESTMPNYNKLARVVYEFDAGDVLGSYLYPAIARTFRNKGFQWITQFAYDPTPLAAYNTEYQTHYLNLLYTPAKALSMMIAAEAAYNIPRLADFGSYPENNRFGNFLVDYENDLSLLNSPTKFYYTNSTDVSPVASDSLRNIAGVGSSPIITYDGSGAYFLDKLNDSEVWRLEVMPDVTLVDDPFKSHNLSEKTAFLINRQHNMSLNLNGMNENFLFCKIAPEKTDDFVSASDYSMTVTPGVYLLANTPEELSGISLSDMFGNIRIDEYHAAGAKLTEGNLPVITTSETHTEPFATDGDEIVLFDPEDITRHYDLSSIPTGSAYPQAAVSDKTSSEGRHLMLTMPADAETISIFRTFIGDIIKTFSDSNSFSEIVVDTRLNEDQLSDLSLGLVTTEGATFEIPLSDDSIRKVKEGAEITKITVPVNILRPAKTFLVPEPYPSFMKREITISSPIPLQHGKTEFIELRHTNGNTPVEIAIEKIRIR